MRSRFGALLLVGALGGVPVWALDRGVEGARVCLAAYESQAPPPSCSEHAGWLRLAARAPWTRRSAERALEELAAREATLRYLDAAVGSPDPAALAERRAALGPALEGLDRGTGRLRVDELGPPLPAPEPASLAARAGDRAALAHGGPRFRHWYEAVAAIDAALLEGDTARAQAIGLAHLDDPHASMRGRAAALACLAGKHDAAIDALAEQERARADKRDANYARDFGELRALVEACAALAGREAPPAPIPGGAGVWDQHERSVVIRVLAAEARCDQAPACDVAPAADDARAILRGDGRTYRLELVASIIGRIDASEARELLRPHDNESLAPLPLSRGRWTGGPPHDEPLLPAERWQLAAERLVTMAEGEDASAELTRAAGMAWLRAAESWAARGATAETRAAAERGGALVCRSPACRALLIANACWAAGDREGALDALERAAVEPAAERPSALAAAAVATTRAQLQASLGRPSPEAAAEALRLAAKSNDLEQMTESALLALALDPDPGAAAALPRPPQLGGFESDPARDGEARARDLDAVLGEWRSRLANPDRRAARYRTLSAAGDVPRAARIAVLQLAARIGDGDIETWLDAFDAIDGRAVTLRERAFTRAEAARARGDARAAESWWRRYRALGARGRTPPEAELWRALR